ncbi:uncharacterized protein BDZ99DRAFT_514592 [Mytilinidion resinicola]|uniref:Uncharacterized protein n=1 Tax=Mytilinidion resinicola TaxID=574789 RepID=A0A6A6Z4M0_9PEZI|nr:uncharacterized protein BDZ99DRAFT_514592 [Mytilinidion resinicola]KAF2815970.1 hypothetical protein BDZ99DRAFT_514592 [Mytilinidion resinicola]
MPSSSPSSVPGSPDRIQWRTQDCRPALFYSNEGLHDLVCGHQVKSTDSECRQNCLHPTAREKQRPPFYCLSCIESIVRSHLDGVVKEFKAQQAQAGKDVSKLNPGFVSMLINTEIKHATSYVLQNTDMGACEVVGEHGRGWQGSARRGRSLGRRAGRGLARDRSMSLFAESDSGEEEGETRGRRGYRRQRSPHRLTGESARLSQNGREVEVEIDDLAEQLGNSLGFRESALIDALVGRLEAVRIEDAE